MLEIRVHGRGGQGAQVGCQILASAFFKAGSWVQAFAYEVEDGLRYTITHEPARLPVRDYLTAQARYRHLDEEAVRRVQEEVDQAWARLVERARENRPREFDNDSDI